VYCVWQVVKTPTIILNNPVLETSHNVFMCLVQFPKQTSFASQYILKLVILIEENYVLCEVRTVSLYKMQIAFHLRSINTSLRVRSSVKRKGIRRGLILESTNTSLSDLTSPATRNATRNHRNSHLSFFNILLSPFIAFSAFSPLIAYSTRFILH
jgi:hypothetical protein